MVKGLIPRHAAVAGLYVALSLGITGVWVHCARTELGAEQMEVTLATGERYTTRFCSIAALAESRMFSPFVRRRLLPDAARLVAAVTPDGMWAPLRRLVAEPGAAPAPVRAVLQRQGWKPESCPVVFSAYLLIWLSALGFMATCRWLCRLLYDTPPWVSDLAGASLGVALLGGYGDWHYCGYGYDIPNAFVFTLTLGGMLAGRWWFPLAFLAAAYSKETAVLLIPTYLLTARDVRWPRRAAVAVLLGGAYAAVRLWIGARYVRQEPPGGFWFPWRNAKYLAYPVFYGWLTPFFVVGLARLLALRQRFPWALKRLWVLAVPMVGLAFFKGWVEEMRQYLELLPVFGLLVFHWCLHEAGLGHLLVARPAGPRSASPVRPPAARAPAA
jgi:hypothetical protein